MDTIDFGPATTTMRGLVAAVTDDQLTWPTPCEKYTVGDLVDHVGGLALAFTAAARKEDLPGAEQGGSGDASRLEPAWRDRIDGSLAGLAEAWRDPAAYEGVAKAGGIEMPGPIAAAVALNEVVVHGWDLATALGRPFEVRDSDVAACMAFAEPFSTPESADQRGDAFGPVVPVPDAAPPLERLLGMMGRHA
ncbi:TIGR03086 family protein [Nocardioides silvaticus]|uniref:TIGR03086 family protein n=1 Tax=Nocardioides silvaticus TaxID=2201891 RepID=A0A316TM53_9ACTN|nr:TIGR03086 family metal-binding protein [Nocardioides silvaticus]PWN03214.1 TIGR03086 family protein [Nocardioides silvaticus]